MLFYSSLILFTVIPEGFSEGRRGALRYIMWTAEALGRENLPICLHDGQFVYKTGRGPTTTTTTTWRFPEGVLKEEIQLWRRSACARELRRHININVVGKTNPKSIQKHTTNPTKLLSALSLCHVRPCSYEQHTAPVAVDWISGFSLEEALPEFGKIGLRKSSRFGKIGFGHFSYQTNLQNVRYLAVICRYLPLFNVSLRY